MIDREAQELSILSQGVAPSGFHDYLSHRPA
jgi:hypothetical protein